MTAAEEGLDCGSIAKLQDAFLRRHDRDTAGIPGIFPLVPNLPLRLTASIDKKGVAYKNARCILRTWKLPTEEQERINGLDPSLSLESHTHAAATALCINALGARFLSVKLNSFGFRSEFLAHYISGPKLLFKQLQFHMLILKSQRGQFLVVMSALRW